MSTSPWMPDTTLGGEDEISTKLGAGVTPSRKEVAYLKPLAAQGQGVLWTEIRSHFSN